MCPSNDSCLGIYPRETNTYVHTKTCVRMSIAALFLIAKWWKQPKCRPMYEWINKMCYSHTKILFTNKKE